MIHVWDPSRFTDWLRLHIVDQHDMRWIWFNGLRLPHPWNTVWFSAEEVT